MANKPLDTNLVDRAILFATKAHAGTERRGKGFPYIIHPLEAMSIVATMTSDPELLAAAVLHDTVEDSGVSVDDLRAEFGDRVAEIVEAESDRFIEGLSEEDSWHSRKQAAIIRLEKASYDAKVVAMGDKLSNLRAIWRDYHDKGDDIWNIFHCKDRAEHEWHYRGLMYGLCELAGTYPYREFCGMIYDIFGPDNSPVRIDMSNFRQSGDGYTAVSFDRLDGRTVVKLYDENVSLDVPMREMTIARQVESLGLPTPHCIRLVTDGARYGTEFERIQDKRSFSRAISENPEKLEYYAVRFAKLTRKLHKTYCDTSVFSDFKDVLRGDIEAAGCFSDSEKSVMLGFVDSAPDGQTCIHGDLHIGNILTNGVEEYWIDLGDFAYGHPYFDLGMFYFVSHFCPDHLTDRLFHLTNIQMRTIWRLFSKAYFKAGSNEDMLKVNALIEPYAALAIVHLGCRTPLEAELQGIVRKIFNL